VSATTDRSTTDNRSVTDEQVAEGESDLDVARHEMGHAVICILVGGVFEFVTGVRTDHGGGVRSRGHLAGSEIDDPFDQATVFMAGVYAAGGADGWINANGAGGHDFHMVKRLGSAGWLDHSDSGTPAWRACRLVQEHRQLIHDLADRLLEAGTLSYDEVRSAVATAQNQ
jgi:hypothetical protein